MDELTNILKLTEKIDLEVVMLDMDKLSSLNTKFGWSM